MTTSTEKAHPQVTTAGRIAHFIVDLLGPTVHALGIIFSSILILLGLFITLTVYAAPIGVFLLLVGILIMLRSTYFKTNEEDEE